MPKPTIDDVARLAGVSPKTVSRVVNREPNVRADTRERVQQAIQTLSYRPNQFARSLASHRSRLIALVYDDPSAYEVPSSGYVMRLQQGTLKACHDENYELLIHPCRYNDQGVAAELQALIGQVRPAGIILAAPLSNMARIVEAVENTGTTLVRLSPGSASAGQLAVATNDREISAEMTRYLASLGHRRIGFIRGHREHKAVGRRYLGYLDGLRGSGLEPDDELVVRGDNSVGSGERGALKLLGLARPPTAIFAANDDMAAGVLRVAAKHGLRVPEQLSVAGCDDIALARQIHPTLTTIRQPLVAMAERAARAIIAAKGHDPHPEGMEVVPAEIKYRESTGPAPG